MPAHSNHHFVPEFLLRQWHTPPDNKLTVFSWKNRSLRASRLAAKSVAKELGLYTLYDMPAEQRNVVEAEVFQAVDREAAIAHQHMLNLPLDQLPQSHGHKWARYVMSLKIRSPWALKGFELAQHRVHRESLIDDGFDPVRAQRDAEEMFLRDPTLARSLSIRSMVRALRDNRGMTAIMESKWTMFDVSASPRSLLIGDRPVFHTGEFEKDFAILIPVSPTKLLCNSNGDNEILKRIIAYPPSVLVTWMNRFMAEQAVEYIFATCNEHEQLARKHLRGKTSQAGDASAWPHWSVRA